jgi:hypothetical protein
MEYGLFGIVSSFTATAAFYPIDSLKTRKQANIPITFNRSLYKGITPELLSCIPSSFVYWYTYQKCRENNFTTTESAFISCATSNIVDTPFDIRKKRYQLNDFVSKNNIAKYCLGNVLSSVAYNLFYLNTLKYCKEEHKINNTFSIMIASTTSAFMSYPFDRWKTYLITNTKINYFKGLGYRLLQSNLYSGLYMSVFLWLSDNKVI